MPCCIEIILNQRTRVTEQKHATHLTPLSNGSLIAHKVRSDLREKKGDSDMQSKLIWRITIQVIGL